MKIQLKNLSIIKTGLVLSRKKASKQAKFKKKYKVISLKSFHKNGYYDQQLADEFIANEVIKDENLLQKGDVLIRLREPTIAVYIDENYKDTIISSLAAVVRVTNKNVNPQFLVDYLNSSRIKRQLYSQGSTVSMLNVKFIGELEVFVPALDIQAKIAQLQALSYKEINLLTQLIEAKKAYSRSIFETLINKEIKND